MQNPIVRKLVAEFLGTFWLVFGGCGSALISAGYPQFGIGFLGVSLAFGLTVLTGGATDKLAAPALAPLAIGLALTLIHLVDIPITNASVNPARSTSQALFVGDWALDQLWLFWVAPLLGGGLGGVIHRFALAER